MLEFGVICLCCVIKRTVRLALCDGFSSDFRGEGEADQLEEVTIMEIASGVLSVPLCLLACYIVHRVWRDQSETYAQMSSGSTAP